jgi:hypothetical protein
MSNNATTALIPGSLELEEPLNDGANDIPDDESGAGVPVHGSPGETQRVEVIDDDGEPPPKRSAERIRSCHDAQISNDGLRHHPTPGTGRVKRWQRTNREKWEEVRKLFVEKGLTDFEQLASITNLPPQKIRTKAIYDKWRAQRREFLAEQDNRTPAPNEDIPAAGNDNLNMIERCRERILKVGTELLGKLETHVNQVSPNDAKEMRALIEGFSDLTKLIGDLIKERQSGGDGGPVSSRAVQVNVLMAAVEGADRAMEAGDIPE